jgi:hypothetical protein
MVGMFVCLCLTSKKPSEREFFVPAGTDLGVKLLRPLDPVVSGTDQDVPNRKQSSLFQQRCCNAYLINDLGGSSRTMK